MNPRLYQQSTNLWLLVILVKDACKGLVCGGCENVLVQIMRADPGEAIHGAVQAIVDQGDLRKSHNQVNTSSHEALLTSSLDFYPPISKDGNKQMHIHMEAA